MLNDVRCQVQQGLSTICDCECTAQFADESGGSLTIIECLVRIRTPAEAGEVGGVGGIETQADRLVGRERPVPA